MPAKQIVFLLLTAAFIPSAAWIAIRYQWAERWLVAGAFLSTSYLMDINLVSRELYRGDTRGFEFGVTDWMMIALMLTMLRAPRWQQHSVQLPPNAIALGAYLLVAALSVLTAEIPLYAGFGLFKMLRAMLVYWVAFNYLRSERDLEFLIQILIAMVAVQFFLVIWQRATGVYRAIGSTPHPNTLAVYVNFTNMILLSYVLSARRRSWRTWSAWAGLTMGVLIVLATFSRGALMTISLGFVTVIGLSLWDGPRGSKLKIVGLMVLAMLPVAIKVTPAIIKRFETAPVESGLSRSQANAAALAMARDHVFGVGLNNYSYVINNTGYARFIPLENDRGIVHNIYLLHASEMGWFGLAVFLIVIVRFLWLGFAFIRQRRDDLASSVAVGIVVGMAALWLQSLLEWLFRQTYIVMEFFMLAGLLAALPRIGTQRRDAQLKKLAALKYWLARRDSSQA